MSIVIASKVPTSVGVAKVEEFFSFCGKIRSVKQLDEKSDSHSFQIEFESPKALTTAVLLDDAELNGVPIKVTVISGLGVRGTGGANTAGSPTGGAFHGSFKDSPPNYREVGAPPSTPTPGSVSTTSPISDHKIQYDPSGITHTGDASYDKVSQEEKPKHAIMAQLLSRGYILSDSVIEKSVKADHEGGYSSNIKSFLSNIDKKYIGTQDENSFANKMKNQSIGTWNKSGYGDKLKQYVDRAASTPYGAKVQGLVEHMSREAVGIHQEALRLKELKKPKLPPRTSSPPLYSNPTDDHLPPADYSAHTQSASTSEEKPPPFESDSNVFTDEKK